MYRGFNLNIDSNEFATASLIDVGKSVFEHHRKLAQQSIDSFKDASGNILADKIMADWFPNLRPHVFISHSHKDSKQAIGLSGWLNKQFGLIAFVDSCVWGYADQLLKAIDDEYCFQKSAGTYKYDMRNRSTAHVHLMLVNSLLRIVDSTECVFFVNTPNSISPKNFIKSTETTASPWLYTELMFSQVIRRRSPRAHRNERRLMKSVRTVDAAMEALEVQYPVNTGHLTPLSGKELLEWGRQMPKMPRDPTTGLDILYSYKEE